MKFKRRWNKRNRKIIKGQQIRLRIIGAVLFLLTAGLLVLSLSRNSQTAVMSLRQRVARLPSAQAVNPDVGLHHRMNKPHPAHVLKVWMAQHKGCTFRVTQLPNCRHMNALIAYDPAGETLKSAQDRLGGVASCSGSFHHPRSMALADFLQRRGTVVSRARTRRYTLAIHDDGAMEILRDPLTVARKSTVSALALGQRLVPLERDGFSISFMNRITDRMAIGLNDSYVYIVQGKSDIWRLADFMQKKLPCKSAINSDGGHVVRGKAPVHIVFKWQHPFRDD